MPLNIPLHPPGYYFRITSRTVYKISNWLVVVVSIFTYFASVLKYPFKTIVLVLFLAIRKANPSHIYCGICQYSKLELPSTHSACKVLNISMPDPFQNCLLPVYGSLKALTMASSTDQKIRWWLFFILSSSIFSIIIQLKIKAKFPCQFHTDVNECYHQSRLYI